MFSTQPITRKLVVYFNGALFLSLLLSAPLVTRAQRALGVDVYEGTGTINWSSVHSAGIVFAFTKATQGNYYEDPNMAANMNNGKAAGVVMGVYDFADPTNNTPSTEANFFWNYAKNYIKADGMTVMPVLDFEPETLGESGPWNGASTTSEWISDWCADIQNLAAAQGINVTPIIYISAGWTSTFLTSANATGTFSWIADYNGESAQTGSPWGGGTYYQPWGSGVWDFWQYSSSGSVSGISAACDVDVFNGTSNQLVSAFLVNTNPIYVTANPTNITVPLGSSATFKITATPLSGSLAYQWRFNQVNISGADTNPYTISSAQLANAGDYTVKITDGTNSYVSSLAILSVLGPLTNAPGDALDPSNMVNWWTGNGNGYDIYGVTNATPFGSLSYTNAKVGMGFRFDGSSAFLSNNAAEIAPPWTVSAWIYLPSAPSSAASLLGDETYAIKVRQYGETSDVGVSHSGVCDFYIKAGLAANAWNHFAITYNGTQFQFYVNGASIGSQLYSNGVAGSVAVPTPPGFELPRTFIGADWFTQIGGDYDDFMSGAVNELQIYNRALAASEIQSIYNAGSAGLVRAPQFTSITNLNNGQVRLNLIGQTGKAITLLSSTNLLGNWTSLGAVSNPNGATNYTDSTAASPQKFYQATQKY